MPERGPAQLLLLFFPPRPRLGWRLGLAAASIALLGLLPGEESVYHHAKAGIAQSLRQAAWKRAVANEPEARSWPWSATARASYSKVPRLGLSAAVLHEKTGKRGGPEPSSAERGLVILGGHDPHLDVDLAVGDRLTVTRADGTREDYRVIGPELFEDRDGANEETDGADPHLPSFGTSLGRALRLKLEAEHIDMPKSSEHKL